jgi:transcriptional regulator with XRE-family HTH domain
MGTGREVRRGELAAFLRARRAALQPRDVGLPDGVRRRTPGLRRQEVAQLAGISVEYYVRLEQGRGPQPSRQVLGALTRALMLTRDEREYLFRMAGEAPPRVEGPTREISPGIRHLLDALGETPAYVVDATYDILAWNRLATLFIGDLDAVPETDHNMVRWMFRRPDRDLDRTDEEIRFARATVADLRAAYARYVGDRRFEELVTELLALSPRFTEMWAEQHVETRRRMVKRVDHPVAGPIEFECQVLHVADTDQRMIVYVAEPGSPTEAVFRRLAAGTARTQV